MTIALCWAMPIGLGKDDAARLDNGHGMSLLATEAASRKCGTTEANILHDGVSLLYHAIKWLARLICPEREKLASMSARQSQPDPSHFNP
jgi:hypothetical protein